LGVETIELNLILIILYVSLVIVFFLFMEFVAWFLHKYLMHGFGWYLHEDHHRYTKGKLEKNDIFGVFFATISFLLILTGTLANFDIRVPIGIGIMLYGIGYFLVHDTFFHKRIKIKYRPKSKYMKRVLNAHSVHHQKSKVHEGVCFGFLYASKKYEVKE